MDKAHRLNEGGAAEMPNLFVIGASKSGSSALHAYLDCHPDITMSAEKEPCFFVDQDELAAAWPIMARQPCSHDLTAYLDLFRRKQGTAFRGEGSVYYSQAPHRSGVPVRIAAASPHARIVYTVREPVSRAIAHYWQRAKEFQEPLPLEQALRENPLYRDTSDYALQLAAYREHFPDSQIFVLTAEELKSDTRTSVMRIVEWLGLPPYAYSDKEIRPRHVSPATSRKQRLPFVKTIRDSAVWAGLRERLPQNLVGALREAGTVTFEKHDVQTVEAREYLTEYFAPRIGAFEDMTGLTLDHWRR